MKKKFIWLVSLLAVLCAVLCLVMPGYAGLEDRFSGIELKSGNYIEFPQITAPTGNPPSNKGWLYVKDNSGTATLYYEDDAGTVTNIVSPTVATAWDDISNPDAAKTITFGTYATILTSAKTDGDMFTFRGTGNFGNFNVVKIESMTGNPTDGTVLNVVSHDTDADALVVTANSINSLVVAGSGNLNLTGGTGTVTYTDWSVTADAVLTLSPDDSPAAVIVISPTAAATTGLDVSNANLTNAISIGAKKILGTTGVIDFTNFDVDGSGNVTCVSVNAGTWKQDAIVPLSAAHTLTVNGSGIGGVTIGGTSTGAITLGGGATLVNLPAATDMTLSGGTLGITDTGNGPALSVTNNSITNTNLLTLSATAMTSGKGVSFVSGAALTGDCFYAQATDGAGFTGSYFRAYDGGADDFSVKRYGVTTIAGNAATDVLILTAGNLQVTAGNVDVDNGQLTVDTDQDLASNISRNFAGAGSAALLTVAEQNAGSTSAALSVSNAGTAAATGILVTHSGDSPTLNLTAGAPRTGDVIAIPMANQRGQRAINISGAITSAAGAGTIEVHAEGVIPATASLLRLDADTAQPGDGDGYILNVDDDTLVCATPKKYAVLINSDANEALRVQTGEAYFDEAATFVTGLVATGDIDIDFSVNTEEMNVTTAASDYAAGTGVVTIYASGAGGATNSTYLLRLAQKADGDAQDHFILCQDNSTGAAANGDEKFAVDSGGAVRAAGGVSPGPTATSFLKSVTVSLTNADIKSLNTGASALVAGVPGKWLELVSVTLILNAGSEALTESADNLVVQYTTSGTDATASIECTGFIDQIVNQVAHIKGATIATTALSNLAGEGLELYSPDGDFAGNASNDATMAVQIVYWEHDDTV